MSKYFTLPLALAASGVLAGAFCLYKYLTPSITEDSSGSPLSTTPGPVSPHLSEDEALQLAVQFDLAVEYMNSTHAKKLDLSQNDSLKLYALYKQGTVGDNTTPKPSLIDFRRSAMWNAWHQLLGTDQSQAKIDYIEFVHSLDPEWRDKVVSKAMYNVLGENATLPDVNGKEEEDDEHVDLSYNREEADRLLHQRQYEANLELEQRRKRELEQKYRGIVGITSNDGDNDDGKSDVKASSHGSKSENPMGYVFSTMRNPESEHVGGDHDGADDGADDGSDPRDGNDEAIDNDAHPSTVIISTPSSLSSSTAASSPDHHSSTIYLHRCPPKYDLNELMEVHDIDILEAFLSSMHSSVVASTAGGSGKGPSSNDFILLVDQYGMSLLHHASDRGFTKGVQMLIEKYKYPIEFIDPYGSTPLMSAISAEQISVVEYLVQHKANVDAKDNDGFSVLDKVNECDNSEFKDKVKALLSL